MGSRESSVVRRPWGNVELLTLTLSFPCNRKRYEHSAVEIGDPDGGNPPPPSWGIAATVETFVAQKRRLKDKNGSLPRASDHGETTPVVRMRKIWLGLW